MPRSNKFKERKGRDPGGKFRDPGAVIREMKPKNPTSRTKQMKPQEFMRMRERIKRRGRSQGT